MRAALTNSAAYMQPRDISDNVPRIPMDRQSIHCIPSRLPCRINGSSILAIGRNHGIGHAHENVEHTPAASCKFCGSLPATAKKGAMHRTATAQVYYKHHVPTHWCSNCLLFSGEVEQETSFTPAEEQIQRLANRDFPVSARHWFLMSKVTVVINDELHMGIIYCCECENVVANDWSH
jgi:hypothetical protein